MTIFLQCPVCSKRYDISNLPTGKKARCACDYRFIIPDHSRAIRLDPLSHRLPTLSLAQIVAEKTPKQRPSKEEHPIDGGSSIKSTSDGLVNNDTIESQRDIHPVIWAIEREHSLPLRLYSLRQQAEEYALISGFDNLLCLSQLKGIDSYDYQERTVRHVLRELGGRALLADEVGLGKTIEAGMIIKEFHLRGLVKKILILTPASLVTQWRDEMAAKFHIHFQIALKPGDWKSIPRVIASIDRAKSSINMEEIHSIKWDLVVVDEAHKLKDKKTLNWKLVNSIPKRYILLLSATPFQNDLIELFNLVTVLRPGHLYTERDFKARFLKRGNKREARDPEQLRSLLRQVMVRNRRGEVGVKFTQRIPETKHLEMFRLERDLYDSAVLFCRNHFGSLYGSAAGLVAVGYLKQLGSSTFSFRESLVKNIIPRANSTGENAIVKDVENLLALASAVDENIKLEALMQTVQEHQDKFLVFTQYRGTQDYIVARLKIEKIPHAVFNGSMNAEEKDRAIGKFKRDSRILVCTESGGEGRNLQFAFRMVNYDLPWNPMRVEQRIGRIHRIGQTRDVYVTNLSCRDTIEDYLLRLLETKLNLFRLVVGEVDGILGKMKIDECIAKMFLESKSNQEFKNRLEHFGEEIAALRCEYERCKDTNALVLGGLSVGMAAHG